jgi:hypothetical protein
MWQAGQLGQDAVSCVQKQTSYVVCHRGDCYCRSLFCRTVCPRKGGLDFVTQTVSLRHAAETLRLDDSEPSQTKSLLYLAPHSQIP